MTTPKRQYKRGTLPNQIEFDSSRFSKAGGNGEIYRGKLHLKSYPDGSPFQYSDVALKRARWGMDDEDMESYVWMGLNHPNLLRFLGLLHEEDDSYLVSPFAPHGSLPEYIVTYPNADRRLFLWQIAAGIAYLHSREVIHGDIKGANILVFDGPTAKLCDFGLSKVADGKQTTNPQFSWSWASPERLKGEPRSYASDTYAFGMTIYEILSGKIPFEELDSIPKLYQAICTLGSRPAQSPEFCNAGVSYAPLWLAAARCWQEMPDERPPMNEVRDEIAPDGADAADGVEFGDLPVLAMPPPSSNYRAQRRKRMDSPETMQAAESSRAPTRRKIYPDPEVGESFSYEAPEPPSTSSHSIDSQIRSLPRAKSASHQAAKSSAVACLPGTRTTVLQKVDDWVKDMDPGVPSVFWLNGMAGTGKSTIAKTLAEAAERNGVLGASFFFDRQGHSEVRNGDLFISTIAFQLARSIPSLKPHLSSALEKNEDVLSFTRYSQLQTLLVGPLQAIKLSNPIIVIIDALDECEPRDAKELLQLLLRMTSEPRIPHALKIFVSCRPDRELDIAFRTAQAHQLLLLHEVEEDVVQGDIEMYITNGLTNPPPHPSLPPNWISTSDLKELTRRSGKLFIYATTVLKYIRDNELDSSRDRLQSLLATRHSTRENPLADLDDLYLQVLRMAIKSRNPRTTEEIMKQAADRVRCLLGVLVRLRTPLPLGALAELVATPLDQMQTTLEHLQSVVMTPKSIDDHPQFLHQSFPDFIIDSNRCLDHMFLINAQDHEHRLANHCLTIMITSLKRNAKGSTTATATDSDSDSESESESESKSKSETGTEPKVKRELAYACLYWASHLAKSRPGNNELLGKLDQFANQCLLWWLEALSVIGEVGKAAGAADEAFKWAILSSAPKQTITLLRDAHRFILAHPRSISNDPSNVYTSALPFTPRATSLWELYCHEAVSSVQVSYGVEEDWLPCLGVLAGHRGGVQKIAFSPDGTRIASGSEDKTVRIWDATSGHSIAILDEHHKEVTTLAFSPDGTRIVSASNDKTARIWNAASGQSIAVLIGHSKEVTSVAFSPNGTRVVSASKDKTLRIWDEAPVQSIAILEGHSSMVYSVAFSPDGALIASGSRDKTLRIWDATSGQFIAVLEGHSNSVNTVAFSPEGTRIISASNDKTVRIWDTASKQSVGILKGHSSVVYSISSALGGTRIVTGSGDKTARIWDAVSGQSIAILKGHAAQLTCVAFSPDGTRIVSASNDRTVRIWDAASRQSVAVLEGHSEEVTTVAFSPDGSRIVSASNDGTLRTWDTESGQSSAVPKGHSKKVIAIAFSPDGTRVVSVSKDKTACIRDAASGQTIAVLKGHSGLETNVAFSPDNTRIATVTASTVRIWDAVSGRCAATLEGKLWLLHSVQVSPDGTRVISVFKDYTVRIRDAASGQFIAVLEGHCGSVTVEFSPDSTRIVTEAENILRVWDAVSGQLIAILEGHSGLATVEFSPDSTRIVTILEPAVRVWDAASGQLIAVLEGHSGWVTVVFSPDSTQIVTEAGNTRVWDVASGQLIAVLENHSESMAVEFSPDSTRIVTASWDTVSVWDAASGQSIAVLEVHPGPVTVKFSLDSTLILTVSENTIRIWDATSGQFIAIVNGSLWARQNTEFSPDGTRIVTEVENTVCVWDAASGQCLAVLEGHSGRVTVEFSPDSTRIVTVSRGTVRVWDAASGQLIAVLEDHSKSVTVKFSPDSTRIVTASWGAVRVWDAASGQFIAVLEGHTGSMTVEFSPDSTRFMAQSGSTVHIWDTASRQLLAVLDVLSRSVTAEFMPDGARIVTKSNDIVRIWDVASGRSIAIVIGDFQPTNTIAFTLDSTRVHLLSANDIIGAWDFISGSSIVETPLLSEMKMLPISQQAVVGEKAVLALLSRWSRGGGVPSPVTSGLLLCVGCISSDGSMAAVGCENGRVFIFHYPREIPLLLPSAV